MAFKKNPRIKEPVRGESMTVKKYDDLKDELIQKYPNVADLITEHHESAVSIAESIRHTASAIKQRSEYLKFMMNLVKAKNQSDQFPRVLKNLKTSNSIGGFEYISAALKGNKQEKYWKGYMQGVMDTLEAVQIEVDLVNGEMQER